ncbi:hypothetical protein T484DRAFT_1964084 [Baffinella frigidus]|nr:hypothetical protein T484DRAFT_1964084 [Cryptophyta sp. CCMP2293]
MAVFRLERVASVDRVAVLLGQEHPLLLWRGWARVCRVLRLKMRRYLEKKGGVSLFLHFDAWHTGTSASHVLRTGLLTLVQAFLSALLHRVVGSWHAMVVSGRQVRRRTQWAVLLAIGAPPFGLMLREWHRISANSSQARRRGRRTTMVRVARAWREGVGGACHARQEAGCLRRRRDAVAAARCLLRTLLRWQEVARHARATAIKLARARTRHGAEVKMETLHALHSAVLYLKNCRELL